MRRLLYVAFLLSLAFQLNACELIMGYRMTARLPNINAYPDNSGLYFDLYTKATEMIGCELKVERLPKKRVLHYIREGVIDFYPGLTFTKERAEQIFFFDNGLPSLDIGLSRKELPEVFSYHDLKDKYLLIPLGAPNIWLTFLGVEDYNHPEKYGIKIRNPSDFTFDRTIELILDGSVHFYADEIGTLNFYLKNHPRKDELKYHMSCCGELVSLTLGFSRASKHLREIPNNDYYQNEKLTAQNFPFELAPETKAYELHQALLELKASGYTDDLYQQYYGVDIRNSIDKQ